MFFFSVSLESVDLLAVSWEIFSSFFLPQVTMPEHTPAGSTVVTLTATDKDSGDNGKITYRVMSSTQDGFYIDPNNGRHPLPSS